VNAEERIANRRLRADSLSLKIFNGVAGDAR